MGEGEEMRKEKGREFVLCARKKRKKSALCAFAGATPAVQQSIDVAGPQQQTRRTDNGTDRQTDGHRTVT